MNGEHLKNQVETKTMKRKRREREGKEERRIAK
jgi:hypothetical protein